MPMSEEQRAAHSRRMRERHAARKAEEAAKPAEPVVAVSTDWDAEERSPEIEIVTENYMPQLPPTSLFEVFLASLTEETRSLLDDAELRAIFAASEKKAKDERRAQLQKQAADKAMSMARADAGLVPKEQAEAMALRERNNRMVKWKVILPFVADTGGIAAEGLVIDERTFYHGQEVTTTYATWLSCREMLYRNRQHEMDFEGRGRLHHLRRNISEFGIDSMMRPA
jgi:hypothetical protein